MFCCLFEYSGNVKSFLFQKDPIFSDYSINYRLICSVLSLFSVCLLQTWSSLESVSKKKEKSKKNVFLKVLSEGEVKLNNVFVPHSRHGTLSSGQQSGVCSESLLSQKIKQNKICRFSETLHSRALH